MWPGSDAVGAPTVLRLAGSVESGGAGELIILDKTHVPSTPIVGVSWTDALQPGDYVTTDVFQHVSAGPAVWEVNVRSTHPDYSAQLWAYHVDFTQ